MAFNQQDVKYTESHIVGARLCEELEPKEGEKVFTIEVSELHNSRHFVCASNVKDALGQARDGETVVLDDTEYVETMNPENWTVQNFKNE